MKIHLRLSAELVPKKSGSKTDTESAGNENQATEGPARISREGKAAEFRVSGFCLRYFLSCKSVSHTSELHRWGSVNKTASGKISGSTEMPDKAEIFTVEKTGKASLESPDKTEDLEIFTK